jgi:hypothetical protein
MAVADDVIRPTINAIISYRAFTSHDTYENAEPSMLDCATSLLNHLQQLSSSLPSKQDASAYRGIKRNVFPFVDAISLWSAEAICAKVTHLLKPSSGTRDQSFSLRQTMRNSAFNHSINLLLCIIDSGIWHSSRAKTQEQQDTQQRSPRHPERLLISRLVGTRICNSMTRLVARLESEVRYPSGTELEPLQERSSRPIPNFQALTDRAPGTAEPAGTTKALWENIGLERQTLVAMCCLAEQLIIDEGARGAGGLHEEDTFVSLKEIMARGQEWWE